MSRIVPLAPAAAVLITAMAALVAAAREPKPASDAFVATGSAIISSEDETQEGLGRRIAGQGRAAVAALGPPAAGACCLIDGCVPANTEAECIALGGVFLPGEDCAQDPCAPGACCSEIACGHVDAFSCITSGRDFMGAGTSCLDDPCEIGAGACCLGDSCESLSGEECSARGGTWLGPGITCDGEPCLTGACCVGDSCSETTQFDCGMRGGAFLPGAICADNPCGPPDLCPENSLLSQSPEPPTGFLAGTSEQSANLIRFEDFTGVAGAVESLTWWGLDLDPIGPNQFLECAEPDPTFRISFHQDAGGVPGAVVCEHTVLATRTPLGISYLGAELNEYSASLPEPCVLVNGWVSIVGLGDPDCWFLWMSASTGSGGSWCAGCTPPRQGIDLSVCLQGTAGGVFGACCDDSAGSCTDGVEITDCLSRELRFAPNATCAELDPPCGTILGACCFADATCEILEAKACAAQGGEWLGPNTICSSCPCLTPCPQGALAEGEPDCSDGYVDLFNGGCLAENPVFQRINPGETICGRSGIFILQGRNTPDQDWYEVMLDSRATLTWTVRAEFPPRIFLLDGNTPCPAEILATDEASECEDASVSAELGAGTYWLLVAPAGFTDTSQCGARYVASLAPLHPPADLSADGLVNAADLAILLGAWSLPPGTACTGEQCAADLTSDDLINAADLAVLLGGWTLPG